MSYYFSYSLFVVVFVIVFLLCHKIGKWYRFYSILKRLPKGPKPLPIIGNALSLIGGFDRNKNV